LIDNSLRQGGRGLEAGSSLLLLLARIRGVRNRAALPHLSAAQIIAWAKEYLARTGKWPKHSSGPVADSQGETWCGINNALRRGDRGLPGGSSVARLLASVK
jgi:hypothetical protein